MYRLMEHSSKDFSFKGCLKTNYTTLLFFFVLLLYLFKEMY